MANSAKCKYTVDNKIVQDVILVGYNDGYSVDFVRPTCKMKRIKPCAIYFNADGSSWVVPLSLSVTIC
jgi:hypothetical protein